MVPMHLPPMAPMNLVEQIRALRLGNGRPALCEGCAAEAAFALRALTHPLLGVGRSGRDAVHFAGGSAADGRGRARPACLPHAPPGVIMIRTLPGNPSYRLGCSPSAPPLCSRLGSCAQRVDAWCEERTDRLLRSITLPPPPSLPPPQKSYLRVLVKGGTEAEARLQRQADLRAKLQAERDARRPELLAQARARRQFPLILHHTAPHIQRETRETPAGPVDLPVIRPMSACPASMSPPRRECAA
jgi:hypothetical protein